MSRPMRSPQVQRAALVEPSLGWTYLSRESLARAKAQMDVEPMGVRDEIGFLTIHQPYADHFFPGTSVLHTRARYAIFVPWLFEDLAGLTGPAAERALRERERVLAGRLRDAGESQVIGSRVFPKPSSQPPSTVYWNALAVWGILRPRLGGRTISRAHAHRLLKSVSVATDDDGQPLLGFDLPFVPLPKRPAGWRDGSITLRLAAAEATFLRERLAQLRGSGGHELSLLARHVRTEAASPPGMWADETRAIAGPDRRRWRVRIRRPIWLAWGASSMTLSSNISSRPTTNGRLQPDIAITSPRPLPNTAPSRPNSMSTRLRQTLAYCRRSCALS